MLVLPINGLDTCINRCLSIDLIFSIFYQQHLLDCTYQYLNQQGRRQGFGGRPALLWDLGCPCCWHQDHSCHCRLPGAINSVKLTSRKYPQPPFSKSGFPFSFSLFQQWPSADELPEEIREIAAFNSVRWVHDYQVENFSWLQDVSLFHKRKHFFNCPSLGCLSGQAGPFHPRWSRLVEGGLAPQHPESWLWEVGWQHQHHATLNFTFFHINCSKSKSMPH